VTAEPKNGYRFTNWTDATGKIVGTDPTLSLADVTSDSAISANFEVDTYMVTFSATNGGGVSGNTVQTILPGSDCLPVVAVPDKNYAFIGWSGDAAGTSNPLTITNVLADLSIIANFKENHGANRPELIYPVNGELVERASDIPCRSIF
jgi:uncharacterized repeat protein (TIGR02543 family)